MQRGLPTANPIRRIVAEAGGGAGDWRDRRTDSPKKASKLQRTQKERRAMLRRFGYKQ